MPIFRMRSASAGRVITSRPWISPFRQRIAAAVSTPSGAPPVPITAWTPVPDDGDRDAGRQVAVADQPDPGAGLADLGDQLLVARPVEHDHHQVVDVAVERPRHRLQVVRDRARRCRTWPRAGPGRPRASPCRCRARGAARPCSAAASTAIAPGAPVAQRFVPSSGSTAMSTAGPLRACRPSRRCRASAPRRARPRRSRSCRRCRRSPSRGASPRPPRGRSTCARPGPWCARPRSRRARRRARTRAAGRRGSWRTSLEEAGIILHR